MFYLSRAFLFDKTSGKTYQRLMNSREVIARLKREGWQLVHVKGSHHHFKHFEKEGRVTVPHPKKDFPRGTLRSIFRQAGWEWK